MTEKVVTLNPHESVGAAAMIFLKHLFHGLPIVNDEKQLVGIVTTHDILKYEFLKEYPNDVFVKETNWLQN
jgi:CBS domain-containing protein